jgi:hypothetical protein
MFRLIQLAGAGFVRGSEQFQDPERTTVLAQTLSVIDDVAVLKLKSRVVEHYQLKNSSKVSVGEGKGSVMPDFRNQLILSKAAGWKPKLVLVVSSSSLKNRLVLKAGRKLSVQFFPYKAKLQELIRACPDLREALAKLSPFDSPNASSEKLLTLATYVLGHWAASPNKVTVKQMMMRLDKDASAFARPRRGSKPLPKDITRLLGRVEGFTFSINKGFFVWSYRNRDSGIFPSHCWTPRYNQLLTQIRFRKPNSFTDLEGLLS